MATQQTGQRLAKIEQALTDLSKNQEKGFDGVHKRLDISNGRIGKLEVCQGETQTKIKNIYKGLDLRKQEWEEKFLLQKDYAKAEGISNADFKVNDFKTKALWGGMIVILTTIVATSIHLVFGLITR